MDDFSGSGAGGVTGLVFTPGIGGALELNSGGFETG
jgi:hypothetical protein